MRVIRRPAERTGGARADRTRTGAPPDARVAARLGAALGVCFAVVFVTGLFSHVLQHPGPFTPPARPAGLYRVTQGLHVLTGVASVPLLLAKLWTVHPKLWAGVREMRERSAAHLRELRERRRPAGLAGTVALTAGRLALVPLTGGAILQVVTGLTNIAYWYPWPFFFTTAHYWTAFLVIGALIIHVANEWSTARHALTTPLTAPGPGPSRRGFLTAVGAATGVPVTVTAGEMLTPVRDLGLLAPRRSGRGQAGVPVNKSAAAAHIRVPEDYRLRVHGAVRRERSWTLDELRALPQHTVTLPIACVEGWSVSARWTGVRVRDLLRAAGVPAGATVRVESLERGGRYRTSDLAAAYWTDPATLLALRCDGEVLRPDHGYPVRLIAPDRPGVLQTKWVSDLVVTGEQR